VKEDRKAPRSALRILAGLATLALVSGVATAVARGDVPDGAAASRSQQVAKAPQAAKKLTSHPVVIKLAKKGQAPQVGDKLTASTKAWGPGKVTVKYQWFRSGSSKVIGTQASYRVTKQDVGHKLSVKATGSKSGYKKAVRISYSTQKVVKKPAKKTNPKKSDAKLTDDKLTKKKA
jgi:hypothetical protein